MRAALVLNERSRRGRREGAAVCLALQRCGVHCDRDPGADADVIIAAGGDGTILAALPMALQRNLPLAIVPLGTFNDLARTLGIPLEPAIACEAIARAKMRAIDVARVNGVYFVNEASIGVSARIARRQTTAMKQRYGYFGVAWTAVAGLLQARSFDAEIEYDGVCEAFSTVQLTVANSRRFGGVIERSDAAIDDGWLDLYSVEMRSVGDAVRVAMKVIRRDSAPTGELRTYRSTRFIVRTSGPHRIVADGEPAGTTPATFDVLPKALKVIVP